MATSPNASKPRPDVRSQESDPKKIIGVIDVSDEGDVSFNAYAVSSFSFALRSLLENAPKNKTENVHLTWDATATSVADKFHWLKNWNDDLDLEVRDALNNKTPLINVSGEMVCAFTVYPS